MCLETCPDGTYKDGNKVCQPCSAECKTCSDASICTLCYPESLIPFLANGRCLSACPLGTCAQTFSCITQCPLNSGFSSISITPTPSTVSSISSLQVTINLDPTVSLSPNDTLTLSLPSITKTPISCSLMSASVSSKASCFVNQGIAIVRGISESGS